MTSIAIAEAKHSFASLLDRVEQGEEVMITRDDRVIARLLPSSAAADRKWSAREMLERMRRRAVEADLPSFEWEEIKQLRDYGRR